MNNCLTCGGAVFGPNEVASYSGLICHCIVPPKYQRLAQTPPPDVSALTVGEALALAETPSEPAAEPLVELLREAGLKERINMGCKQASADEARAQLIDAIDTAVWEWKTFWMNQTQNSEADRVNYFTRAFGVDANMRHDLVNRCTKAAIEFVKGGK